MYYKFKGEVNFTSSGLTAKAKAESYVNELLKNNGIQKVSNEVFENYAGKFFLWDSCPHVARLREEGKSITKRYVAIQRTNLETHVLKSRLQKMRLQDIRRSHILDFRTSITKKDLASGTVNKIMSVLRVIFNEAVYRQDIVVNPMIGVSDIKDNAKPTGIFSIEELDRLFPDDFKQIWNEVLDYTCFFLAATTGMRRGEVLALKWKHIHFDQGYISVEEAWKDLDTTGPPKSNHSRTVPMANILRERLILRWEDTYNKSHDDLVFCNIDGSRLGETWWKKRFDKALERAEIPTEGRRLRPHSFRHTLNTMLRASGENPDKIRVMLGWNSEAVQDRYTHWEPAHMQSQGDVIDALWVSEEAQLTEQKASVQV
jgi:integrase